MSVVTGLLFGGGIAYLAAVLFVRFRALPEGFNFRGPERWISEDEITFLSDLTWWENGTKKTKQSIFDAVFETVSKARRFILVDMFLFAYDFDSTDSLPTTRTLTELIIKKKRHNPSLSVVVITDPVNNAYGNYTAEPLQAFQDAGIPVIMTDIDKLRDGNFLYGGFWLLVLKWWGIGRRGWLPHPLGGRKHRVTIRSLLKALNARANHRKVIIADEGDSCAAIISSANIHEASSWHSNIAFKIKGPLARDIAESERAVARLSGCDFEKAAIANVFRSEGDLKVRLLTEDTIGRTLLMDLDRAGSGDVIYLAMFYLSDKRIIDGLVKASKRDARVLCILDANDESFGTRKIGLPNQISAQTLQRKSRGRIQIRWAASRKEQFHAKMLVIRKESTLIVYGGSANFTKRNTAGFTLETGLRLEGPLTSGFSRDVLSFVDFVDSEPFSSTVMKKASFLWLKRALYQIQHLLRFTTY